jgi:hypothetical protein
MINEDAKGYKGNLKNGAPIYIPSWTVEASIKNLAYAGKILGSDSLLRIADINIPAVMQALTKSEDPAGTAHFVKEIACQARIDGERVSADNYDSLFEGRLYLLCEVFATVIHAQYYDFFVQGLAKENSPES